MTERVKASEINGSTSAMTAWAASSAMPSSSNWLVRRIARAGVHVHRHQDIERVSECRYGAKAVVARCFVPALEVVVVQTFRFRLSDIEALVAVRLQSQFDGLQEQGVLGPIRFRVDVSDTSTQGVSELACAGEVLSGSGRPWVGDPNIGGFGVMA